MSRAAKIGQAMVVSGLFIQIIMFGLSAVIALIFEVRAPNSPFKSSPTTDSINSQSRLRRDLTPESFSTDIRWKQSLDMLYTVSALIMIRSIFRAVEYLMGTGGYPLTHEWTLYCLGSVLMFGATVVFFLRYSSELKGRGDNGSVQILPQSFLQK